MTAKDASFQNRSSPSESDYAFYIIIKLSFDPFSYFPVTSLPDYPRSDLTKKNLKYEAECTRDTSIPVIYTDDVTLETSLQSPPKCKI